MVAFNPQIPEIQVQNLPQFRPITAPSGNKSSEILMNTLGGAITDAASIADTAVKQDIDKQIYAQTDIQRDAYTSALESIKSQITGQPTPPINSGVSQSAVVGQPMSLLPQSSTNVPQPVQDIGDKANALVTARNAGKINDTYYTQQLNAMLKNVRAEYPGYRDYIDQKVSQATGINPANAYMANMLQDINRGLANQANQGKDINTLLMSAMKSKVPGATEMYAAFQGARAQGVDMSGAVLNWWSSVSAMDAQHKAIEVAHNEKTWNDSDNKLQWGSDFDKISSDYTANGIRTFRIGSGASTIDNFVGKVVNAQRQGQTIDPETLNQGLSAIVALRAQTARDLQNKASAIQDNGQSYNSVLGNKGVKDKIDAALAPYDTLIDMIQNKQYGAAFAVARQIEGIQSSDQLGVLTSPKIGDFSRKIDGLSKINPQLVPFLVEKGLTDKNLVGNLQTFFTDKETNAFASPNAAIIDDFRAAKKLTQGNTNNPSSQTLYKKIIEIPSIIGSNDPRVTDQNKMAAANYAFNPKNIGLLNEMAMDGYVNGQYVPGKYFALSVMTSPQITNQMWKMKQQGGQGEENWQNYKNWTETEFGKLYRTDVNNLNEISRDTPLHVGWDDQNQRLILLDKSGRPFDRPGAEQRTAIPNSLDNAVRVINRLNTGLSSIKEINKKEGGDTSSYLARMLLASGLNPDEMTGIPKEIMDNISRSKLQKSFFRVGR